MKRLQRRGFFQKLSLGVAGLGLFPALAWSERAAAAKGRKLKGKFLHVVYFWLKNPESEADREKFLHELTTFIDNMDVIVTKHVGTPAGTSREVIDSSYSYCLALSFKNREDQDIYQDHPLHKKFIENAGPLWERVVVYDSLAV